MRLYSFPNNKIKPDFPTLVDEIAEPRPYMNIKVAAFTESEKSYWKTIVEYIGNSGYHDKYRISSVFPLFAWINISVPTVCLDKHQPQSPEYNIILETITSDPSIYTMDRLNIYGRFGLKISLTIVLTCPRGLSFKTVSALCSSFDHSSSLLGSPCQSLFSARTIMAFQHGAEPEPQYRNMFLFDIFLCSCVI